MPRISQVIPQQQFELVRDRIGEIIIDELSNQVTLSGNQDINASVFVERYTPFEFSEMPAINISLGQGSFENKTAPSSDGSYTYFIDVYTAGVSTDEDTGDKLASIQLQRIMGVCRAILEDPQYRTLGFNRPSISNVACVEINIADPGKQDSANTLMGRLTFRVRVPEGVDLLNAGLIDGYETVIKIGTGNFGYKYIGENY